MEIRCPIHGLIEYTPEEERLINSHVIQRLRGIRQLAMAYLVYPGCLHTRFEHSIGVMHAAGRMARQLQLDDDKRRIVRLAGLLHDCGHGPFSHVSEQLLEKLTASLPDGVSRDQLHEQITWDIIRTSPEITSVLGRGDTEAIVMVLDTVHSSQRTVMQDIISGRLDADKLDYLLRDSYYAGVKYGVFDLDRVIASLCAIDMGRGEQQVGVTEEGIHAVEQMILARYHMSMQVYYHRIRAITDAMTVKGLLASVEEGNTEVRSLYDYVAVDNAAFLNRYLAYTDNKLVDSLLAMPDGSLAKEFFQRLAQRRLLKQVMRISTSTAQLGDAVTIQRLLNSIASEQGRIEHEKEIARELGVPEGLVVVAYQSMKNPTYRAPGPVLTKEDIVVLTESGERESFNKVSQIFSDRAADPQKGYLCVYAPVDIEDRAQRQKSIARMQDVVKKHFGYSMKETRNGRN